METDEFEWDDAKAAKNFDNHQIRFEDATFAFDDPAAIDLVERLKPMCEPNTVTVALLP
jgi:uncharacterized DUF497 family protein